MIIQCPSCGARASVPETAVGRSVKCPQCRTLFTVAAASYEPRSPAYDEPPPPPARRHEEPEYDEPAPRTRRAAAADRPRRSVLGLLGFLMGGLALLVALAALGLTLFRDPLGGGLRKYNFSTPRDSIVSQSRMLSDMDFRAMMELGKIMNGKRDEEKIRTLDIRKEVDYAGKKIIFYAYEFKGKKQHGVDFFEKDNDTGYWLPDRSDFRWREDLRKDRPEVEEWIHSFPGSGEFRDQPKWKEGGKFKDKWGGK